MDVLRDAAETKEIELCAFLDIEGARCPDSQGSGKHPGLLNGKDVRK